jgi:hypothetical protein
MKLVHLSLNEAYFLKVVPFRWARTKNKQVHVLEIPSKGKFCGWDLVKFLFLTHQLFLSVRLIQSIFSKNVPLVNYVIEVVYYAQFFLASLFEVSLIHNQCDWVMFVNKYLQYFKSLEGKYIPMHYITNNNKLPSRLGFKSETICV